MRKLFLLFAILLATTALAQSPDYELTSNRIRLDSKVGHNGSAEWLMQKASTVPTPVEAISKPGFKTDGWLQAIVPGTVLTSLVNDKQLPEPYYGLNNRIDKGIIPDIAKVGRDYYTYWFRTEFDLPADYKGKTVWLQLDGINYRAEVWLNGHMVGGMAGMFRGASIDVTDFANIGARNALAIKVLPVDIPGTIKPKTWGAKGEWHNGGDGNIGLNTTMLMSVGWDFTFNDGIRDRNTGIWRGVSLYATSPVRLANAFVKSKLNSTYDRSDETVSVEVVNPLSQGVKCTVEGKISGTNISFSKNVDLMRGETKVVEFKPSDFPQLTISNPRLWWPIHKGPQNLYELKLVAKVSGATISDSLTTRFGIREIKSDQNTPDHSRQFYINGKKIFVRGTNWVPEAMLRNDDSRTWAELRYNQLSGINFIRLWGGGIAESDYFYQLCDEMGFMVWQEFWMTGDTKHPQDGDLYLANVESTVKRIRNHPCIAYYVSSNESTEMPGAKDLIMKLDGTRGYQMASEVDGVHDGSPYKQVNPMQNYENTASDRGSRIDGFNPEYGAPTIPIAESLREIMDEKDLWPINKEVWDYHDGGGFHLMSTLYKQLTDQYGQSKSIDEFAEKGQFVGAMNSKSIWETWNENKLGYGDRYTSGLLFWYQNCPVAQVCGRMYDHSLEPTASLYYTCNSLEPLHPQFDYLKNTVSVVNDYYQAFHGYTVTAEVYDINSKLVWKQSAKVDLPEDGVANNVIKIDFPKNISQVHFIKLRLLDDKGKQVGDNFYWRSNDEYKGRTTVTGPCTSGFEDLSKLPTVRLTTKVKKAVRDGRGYLDVKVKNSGKAIAFFAQMMAQDKNGKSVKPCYFTDNFLCLLPGEEKTISVDMDKAQASVADHLLVKGWNVEKETIKLK